MIRWTGLAPWEYITSTSESPLESDQANGSDLHELAIEGFGFTFTLSLSLTLTHTHTLTLTLSHSHLYELAIEGFGFTFTLSLSLTLTLTLTLTLSHSHLHELAIEGLGGSLLGAEVVGFELVVLADDRIQFLIQQQDLSTRRVGYEPAT